VEEGRAAGVALVAVPGRDGRPGFLLGRTPVTNAQYAPFVAAGHGSAPPWWSDPDFRDPEQPVVGVTWDEAADFCAWLGKTRGSRCRLPTGAEWEHAASGGRRAPATAWGDALPPGEIPGGPLSGPWRAGRGAPNDYGLCDMGTIVHEWCLGWSREGRRESRGGSWRHAVRWSRPSAASSLPPSYRYADYGFRVLCETGPL